MRLPKRSTATLMLVLIAAPQTGCLERKESIRVMADGE